MIKRDETVNVQTMYVSIDKIRVENVHTYNYLGVIVDDKLTFIEFTDNKYNMVNMRLYHLKHLRPNINNDIAKGPLHKESSLLKPHLKSSYPCIKPIGVAHQTSLGPSCHKKSPCFIGGLALSELRVRLSILTGRI